MPNSSPRRVLILGASGLIGSAVLREASRFPDLICVPASREKRENFITLPYSTLTTPQKWAMVLRENNIHTVVNCVGIWEGLPEDFELIQYTVPTALGLACAYLKLHLVHVSALGFGAESPLHYVSTKAKADQYIREHVPGSTIVSPSLVFGQNGESTRFFMKLAALPVHANMGYPQNLQPVHVEDVARTIVDSMRGKRMERQLDCAGRTRISVTQYLAHLRKGMGLGKPWFTIPVPKAFTRAMFLIGERMGSRFVNEQTYQLLSQGTHSAQDFPSATPYGLYAQPNDALGALNACLYAFTRFSVGALWLLTALVTWWFWPQQETLQWLSEIHPALGSTSWLAASCVFDALMGLFSFLWPSKRLWKTQFWVTVGYTLGLIVALPSSLAHPLGLVTKNLCVLAAQAYLALNEKSRK